MRKVKITRIPSKTNNQSFWNSINSNKLSSPGIKVRSTIEPVPEEESNLEAEKGEVVVGDINNDTLPEFYKVGGDRHYDGGTPLSLPENTFIFSRDKDMRIKEEIIQKEFGKAYKKKGYTPAELAIKYDINKYRKLLQDPDSDEILKRTAESMIANYNLKLGKLALVQESMKGFPQGIPQIAIPYLTVNNIDPASFIAPAGPAEGPSQTQGARHGAEVMKKLKKNKYLPVYEHGSEVSTVKRRIKISSLPRYQEGSETKKPGETTPTASLSGLTPSERYKKLYGTDITEDTSKAALLLEAKSKDKDSGVTLNKKTGKYEFFPGSKRSLSLQDKILITQVASYNKENNLGSGELKIGTQHIDKGSGFVGFITPDVIEYQYWKSNRKNLNKPLSEFEGLPKEDKEKNRVNYLKYMGYTPEEVKDLGDKISSPDQLYTEEFVGKPGKEGAKSLTRRVEEGFGEEEFRPVLGKNYFGLEHADFYIQPEEKETTKPAVTKETGPVAERKPFVIPDVKGQVPKGADWWLQDVVKTFGSAADLGRIKKYTPWGAPIEPFLPEPTFYDPTRELAANAEQMQIGTQGAAMFAGPQTYSARFSRIQGEGARNAADILAKYNNMNVTAANQFALTRAEILNRAEGANKQLSQDLYDKTTIANQQFDNAKAKAREQLRSSFIDAITNRANAQVLNELYPQYNIAPLTGGMMRFTGGRDLIPSSGQERDVMKEVSKLKYENPGFDDSVYLNAAKLNMNYDQPTTNVPDSEYFDRYTKTRKKVGGTR